MRRGSFSRNAAVFVAAALSGACVVPQGGRGTGLSSEDAGTDVASGDAACARFKCPVLECGTGMMPLKLPGECCSALCVPDDCSTVDCTPPVCPAGTHAETPPGSCCAECATNGSSTGTCEDGQTGYSAFLARELATATASNCTTDGDCRLVSLDNACGASCGTAVSVRGAASVVASANAYAAANCGACPAATPCPPVEQFAICSGGICASY
jgi:hypothetical protein